MSKTKITREEWLNNAVVVMRPMFEAEGYKVPKALRVSCSFPSRKALPRKPGSNHTIGQCWDKSGSMDGNFELFISPLMDDLTMVLATLAHEVVHAVVGLEAGHKAPFKKCALAIGLEGKMTATVAGDKFKAWVKDNTKALGAYPHARLNPNYRPTKKQTTRMLKCECSDCGYVIRTSAKWADAGMPTCVCGGEFTCEGA